MIVTVYTSYCLNNMTLLTIGTMLYLGFANNTKEYNGV